MNDDDDDNIGLVFNESVDFLLFGFKLLFDCESDEFLIDENDLSELEILFDDEDFVTRDVILDEDEEESFPILEHV